MSANHFFLVIEGLDGSGKSALSRQLALLLRAALGDEAVLLTFQPHDPSSAGLFIRQVLARSIVVSSRTLALAYALNRADHLERVINPFLSGDGPRVVVCDRYVLSSLVYQSTETQPMDAVLRLNDGARPPDLTLFLDVRPETANARIDMRAGARELFEQNFAETRQKYHAAIAFLRALGAPVDVIDANNDLLTVLNRVVAAINAHSPGWLHLDPASEITADAVPPSLDVPLEHLDHAIDQAIGWYCELWQTVDRFSNEMRDSLRAALEGSVRAMSLDELAALFLAYAAQGGYRPVRQMLWAEAVLYDLDCTLPMGVQQRGAALILPDGGRYDLITRALHFLADVEHGSAFSFLLVFDPASLTRTLPTFTHDSPTALPVQIIGRHEIVQYLYNSVLYSYRPPRGTGSLAGKIH